MPGVMITRYHVSSAKTFIRKYVLNSFLKEVPELMRKMIGNAPDGSRLWPNKKLDSKIGIRIDFGQKWTDANTNITYRNFVVQANSNADNPTIQALVAKNGAHDKRIVIAIPMNTDGTDVHEAIVLETELNPVMSDGI